MFFELAGGVGHVDGSDHAVATIAVGNEGLFHQGMNHRCRVGQAGSFEQHPIDGRNLLAEGLHEQPLERRHQIALHAAAHATAIEHDQGFIDLLDQMVVDADVAQLVDQHRHPLGAGVAQQVVEHSRFAGAEKAGQHGHRNAPVSVSHRLILVRSPVVGRRRPPGSLP